MAMIVVIASYIDVRGRKTVAMVSRGRRKGGDHDTR
jgi:hypothetical protein